MRKDLIQSYYEIPVRFEDLLDYGRVESYKTQEAAREFSTGPGRVQSFCGGGDKDPV